ncbi:hypothetical protein S40288_11659 [Stachybotrys chartarum IBT 40288]|nr:hypothetical protein S40288_11659 [Stachybotrys chartarum IBT 40288]
MRQSLSQVHSQRVLPNKTPASASSKYGASSPGLAAVAVAATPRLRVPFLAWNWTSSIDRARHSAALSSATLLLVPVSAWPERSLDPATPEFWEEAFRRLIVSGRTTFCTRKSLILALFCSQFSAL